METRKPNVEWRGKSVEGVLENYTKRGAMNACWPYYGRSIIYGDRIFQKDEPQIEKIKLSVYHAAMCIWQGDPYNENLKKTKIKSLCKCVCINPAHFINRSQKTLPKRKFSLEDYFWVRTKRMNQHLLWTGSKSYGLPYVRLLGNGGVQPKYGGTKDLLLLAYQLQTGDILKSGLVPIPSCGNVTCLWISHMEFVTENQFLWQIASFPFWERVKKADPNQCWPWQGHCDNNGYGKYSNDVLNINVAHRFAYILTYGQPQLGHIIRHTCDNPPCCNPTHLVPGTYKDNAQDRIKRARSVMPKDIKYNIPDENMYYIRTQFIKFTKSLARKLKIEERTIINFLRK